jgi:hypothetical protein
VRRLQAATRASLRDLQHYQTLDYALMLLREGWEEVADYALEWAEANVSRPVA